MSVRILRKKGLQSIIEVASISRSGIFITDKKARILYANASFLNLTGYTEEEVIGENPRILKSGKQNEAFYETLWEGLIEDGSFDAEVWDKKKSGAIYPKHMRIRRVDDPYFNTYYYVAVQEDLTGGGEQSHIEYHARSLLPNQHALKQLIEKEYTPSRTPFVLYYVRIQNRSPLEAVFGFDKYTRLLQTYAKRIHDYLGDDGFVAEMTHYTLVVISPDGEHTIDKDATEMVKMGRMLEADDIEAFFNVNIGVSFYPGDAENTDDLLRNARLALDHVQHNPGKSFALHEETLEKVMERELIVGSYLPKALKKDEFHMVYQPQYRNDELVGVEALMRWESPALGSVGPDVFIKVAEEGGWIGDLTALVFKLLKKDLKKIHDKAPHLRVAINLSSSQLSDEQCLQGFAELHTLTGLPAEKLEIEVTEGVLITDLDYISKRLQEFKDNHMRIAIDDFGTGFSTMTHLESIPADMLKIDKSFVMGYPYGTDGNIAALIINTAEKLGLDVIAEGVETKAQKTFLEEQGCTFHQGFYYSEPLDIESLLEKL